MSCANSTPRGQLEFDQDLNGDGTNERMIVSATTNEEEGILRLSIGDARYVTSFFAGDEDPGVKLISFDSRNHRSQILITVPGVTSCGYEYVGFDGKAFYRIGRLESDHCVFTPTDPEDRRVSLKSWEGFWTREVTYEAVGTPESLKPLDRVSMLDIATVTTAPITIEATAHSPSRTLHVGSRVTIKRFDPSNRQYEVEMSDGTRQWMSVSWETFQQLLWAD